MMAGIPGITGLLVDMKMKMLVFHLTVAGSNLLQGDYDGWIKSGKREYDRNDSVINDYRAGGSHSNGNS